MTQLSERQLAIQERDAAILDAARAVLLERGYFGLTMEAVAKASACPKGTMYQRFGCKEDMLVALALRSLERRLAMMARGGNYKGLARERVLALGEAVSLFTRLYPDDSRIMHAATGPVREKAAPDRIRHLMEMEQEAIGILKGILEDAVAEGRRREFEEPRLGLVLVLAFDQRRLGLVRHREVPEEDDLDGPEPVEHLQGRRVGLRDVDRDEDGQIADR